MNKDLFIKELEKIGIEPTSIQLKQLEVYMKFLIEYNSHTNLTAIKEPEDIYLKHFYDSLVIARYHIFTNEKVLDIGTGPGFPGMILKIFFPNIRLTLLDSNNKKIKFLIELASKLGIENIEIICGRAEEIINKKREEYDIVTSRAVSNLTTLSELSLPFVKIGGYFIPLKGQNKEEIIEAEDAIEILGGILENEYNYELPIEKSKRTIIVIKKINNSPSKYPRQYGKIVKNPLKKTSK